jgi:ATP-dependent phosphoenolpyruvate carboxykinase
MDNYAQFTKTISLEKYGIKNVQEIIYNPSYEFLYDEELKSSLVGFERGQLTELGAVNVMTGDFTGRSPKDKYIVEDEVTRDTIWWSSDKAVNDNKPISTTTWNALKETTVNQLSSKKLYVIDAQYRKHFTNIKLDGVNLNNYKLVAFVPDDEDEKDDYYRFVSALVRNVEEEDEMNRFVWVVL